MVFDHIFAENSPILIKNCIFLFFKNPHFWLFFGVLKVKLKFQDQFYDIFDHNKCPSSEKEDENCILRQSYFHQIQPSYTQSYIFTILQFYNHGLTTFESQSHNLTILQSHNLTTLQSHSHNLTLSIQSHNVTILQSPIIKIYKVVTCNYSHITHKYSIEILSDLKIVDS